MNFLYKEPMCNGTNKGPESRRLRSRAGGKKEGRKDGRKGESERGEEREGMERRPRELKEGGKETEK